jgi:putative endopeptidase
LEEYLEGHQVHSENTDPVDPTVTRLSGDLNLRETGFSGIAKLVKSEPLEVWKDYLTLHDTSEAAPYLSKAFVDARFEFYGKTLTGTPTLKDRWKRGVDQVTGALGEAVGKLYVTKYFTPATKASADELVKNLVVAMGQRLDKLAWMSDETKAKAKAKLATYNPKIGYPKKWRDYSKLAVKANDPYGNASRAAAFEYNRRLAKLGKPVDRDEWGMTPMTVNAYYNPVLNEIVFPAAILQPPFFDANADAAVNYGGIGAVIGHEIATASTTRAASTTPRAHSRTGGRRRTTRSSRQRPPSWSRSTTRTARSPRPRASPHNA